MTTSARGKKYLDSYAASLAGLAGGSAFILGREPGSDTEMQVLGASNPALSTDGKPANIQSSSFRDLLFDDPAVVTEGGASLGVDPPLASGEGCVGLPLVSSDSRVVGAVVALTDQRIETPDEILKHMRSEAPRLSAEVESMLQAAEIHCFEERCRLIAEVTNTQLQSRPGQHQMNMALEIVCKRMHVDAAVLRTVDSGELELVACSGVPSRLQKQRLPVGEGIAREIMSVRRALAIENVPQHPATIVKIEHDDPNTFSFRSYAGAPMISDDVVTGILGVYSTAHTRKFTPTDLSQLQILANFFALTVLNRDLFNAINRHLVDLHQSRFAQQGAPE